MDQPTDLGAHWDAAYGNKGEEELTWFEPQASLSLELIRPHIASGQALIDIGGGASRFVDGCLEAGLGPVSVLDLSENALALTKARLGELADQVAWIVADVTEWAPARSYTLWHDRAAFHFLTSESCRAAYVRRMETALAHDGIAVISSFAEDGPERCSNLPVQRYAPQQLLDEVNRHAVSPFALIQSRDHTHKTPRGGAQSFQISILQRA
ncbi:MAG: class I SAM-dependent methyltransferase [Brevirhabdus sp.]